MRIARIALRIRRRRRSKEDKSMGSGNYCQGPVDAEESTQRAPAAISRRQVGIPNNVSEDKHGSYAIHAGWS